MDSTGLENRQYPTKPSQPSAGAAGVAKLLWQRYAGEAFGDISLDDLAHIIDDAYRDRETGKARKRQSRAVKEKG